MNEGLGELRVSQTLFYNHNIWYKKARYWKCFKSVRKIYVKVLDIWDGHLYNNLACTKRHAV